MGRRREIEADDIANFVDEQRIARQFERLGPLRLQPECIPHPADRRVRISRRARHPPDRPVRRVPRRSLQRPLDHGSNLVITDRARSTRTRLIKQTIYPLLQKPPPPFANRALAPPTAAQRPCSDGLERTPRRSGIVRKASVATGDAEPSAPDRRAPQRSM